MSGSFFRGSATLAIVSSPPRSSGLSIEFMAGRDRAPGSERPAMLRAVDIIRKKRDGGCLSWSEIDWMVEGIASGEVADYQWSALLMAICLNGMDSVETASLTEAML